jgi:hypothetical protein
MLQDVVVAFGAISIISQVISSLLHDLKEPP